MTDAPPESVEQTPTGPTGAPVTAGRTRSWRHWLSAWREDLTGEQRAGILAWASFTTTFTGVRALTHWLRAGHGLAGGGIVIRGRHLHHYNIGIAILSMLGSVLVRSQAVTRIRRHPVIPLAYGAANALIADEAALLLDLQDVYWSKQGRTSVDLAVGTIGAGGLAIAAIPLMDHVRSRADAPQVSPTAAHSR